MKQLSDVLIISRQMWCLLFDRWRHITMALLALRKGGEKTGIDVFHWLPVPQRIQFKIAAVTFDCPIGNGPAYFSSIVCTVADNSGRPGLRSAERGDLFVPRTRSSRLGSSSCLELTAASPSLAVHQSQSVSSRAQDSSFQAGLSLTFPLRTIEEIELN